MTSTTSHLPTYLRAALASDSARPRITYYDDATGERVELSALTLAGWVTKTVNLLTDELGVEPGARVSLHLPLHWLTGVWVIALDACAADMIINPSGALEGSVDIAVMGPDSPGATVADIVDRVHPTEVLAVSLAPMAAPFGRPGGPPLPPGARDFCAEVRTMPDQVVLAPETTGLLHSEGAARATELSLAPKARLTAFDTSTVEQSLPPDVSRLIDALVAPLTVDGSALWVRNPNPELCVTRWEAEQVTAVLSPLPGGITAPNGVARVG